MHQESSNRVTFDTDSVKQKTNICNFQKNK